MDVFGGEKQACPCSKKCQSFQKLLELKNSGLVVYLHRPHADDACTPSLIRQGGAVRGAVNPSDDVIIIYNKKNVKITTSELTSEFEKKNISCPRCRKTFEHAQELMQGVKSIDRKIIMGICDHCRKKSQTTEKPFCDCDQIVKKFMYVKGEQKEDTKKYDEELFPPEIGFFRTGATLKKQKKTRTYSDTQINLDLNSPSRHDPDVQPMFYSHTDLKSDTSEISETDSKQFYRKKAVKFIQPHESVHARTPAPSFLEPGKSLKDHKREEILEDIPSLDAKEALKIRHDLSLRQMMRLEKDTDSPHSVSKRPEVYETPKNSPWEQMETISKYHVGSKTDLKKIPTPTKTKSKQDRSARNLDELDDPNRQLQFRSLRTSQRNIQDSYFEPSKFDTNHHDKVFKKDEELKIQSSVDKISLKMKKTKQSKSESLETVAGVLKPYFSFSFPKIKEQKIKEIEIDLSSSHLIKEIQENYAQKAEREKEKLEQALKKKLAREEKKLQADEKKRQAREEKILQAEEKKRQALEDKKNQALQDKKEYAEEQEILTEKDKSKELAFEIDGEPVVAKTDTKSISKRQSKTKSGIEKEPEPKIKADDGEAKSDEGLGTIQKEKTEIGKGAKSDLDKKAERDKILKEEREPDMEDLKKQAAKEKELMKRENQEKDATSKKETKKTTSEKAKRTKKTGRDSSDRTNLTMPKIQKLLVKEINVSVKKTQSQQKSPMEESPPGMTAAELQKLRAELRTERLQEKEERQKTIQNQSKKIDAVIRPHRRRHQQRRVKPDSKLELDVLSLEFKNDLPKQKTDIIIGENIFKSRPRLEKPKKQDGVPIFFQKDFVAEPDHRTKEEVQTIPEPTKPMSKQILGAVSRDTIELDPRKGVIHYALSDRAFIDKGWTMLPTEKVVRKMNVYRMRPAYPEFDWFDHNKNKGLMTYDTGERLAEFDDNGRGRWYYRSGRLALDYYDAEGGYLPEFYGY